MNGIIEIEGMEFFAFHGCYETERVVGNKFMVYARIETDCTKAAQTDNIEDALNYLTAYEVIAKEMMITSHLLEHVAQRMINALYNAFNYQGFKTKPAIGRKDCSHERYFIQINYSKVLQNPKYCLIFATQNRKRVGWPSG